MNHEGNKPLSQESRTPVRTSDKAAPRDQRLVHRMSQMTLEIDLPGDMEHITSPRMKIIHQSNLSRYWSFMTDPTATPPLPVPRSIMEPSSPEWTAALLEEHQAGRDEIILNLYGLSPQDRIQVRDTMKYTILNQGRGTEARPEQVEAYVRRMILQLGEILAAGGYRLSATIHPISSPESILACRFHLEDMESPQKARDNYEREKPTVRTEPLGTKEELIQMLIPEAQLELEKTDPSREALRVYQDKKNFWRIAARWEYLWSEPRHDGTKTPCGQSMNRRRKRRKLQRRKLQRRISSATRTRRRRRRKPSRSWSWSHSSTAWHDFSNPDEETRPSRGAVAWGGTTERRRMTGM